MDSQDSHTKNQPRRVSRWLATALCIGLAAVSGYSAYKLQHPPADQEIAKATDKVYEAVIRDMLPREVDKRRGLELVFDDRLIVGDFPGGNVDSCQAESTKWVQVTDDPPLFDTTTDRMYRFLTSGVYRTAPRPETVESYLQVRCLGGRLSHTFHTDVPRSFLSDYVNATGWVVPAWADPKFARLFPGSSGVIGLSRVGLDKDISEAIVSTSYVCGGLCGSGHRYFLKKVGGVWQVVSKRETWVS